MQYMAPPTTAKIYRGAIPSLGEGIKQPDCW